MLVDGGRRLFAEAKELSFPTRPLSAHDAQNHSDIWRGVVIAQEWKCEMNELVSCGVARRGEGFARGVIRLAGAADRPPVLAADDGPQTARR